MFPDSTRDADLGVHPIERELRTLEYIQAGLPVEVTDLPDIKRIVTQYRVGEVFRDGDAEDLASKIDKMLLNGDKYRLASGNAAKDLNWDVEKHRLIEVYKSVLTL